MWLSQFDLFPICVNEGKQRRKSDYIRRVEQLLENVVSIGINTLFVQVRPNGDSFYPSALFPSSRYATGRIGAAFDYDPFSILLARAHGKGLSVHAWINPLRCFSEQDRATLTGEYPTLIWTENTSETKDVIVPVGGVWYLNPSREAARSLICDGAREILSLYTVDGIHIDDYFYPTTDPSFDSLSFAEYQKRAASSPSGSFGGTPPVSWSASFTVRFSRQGADGCLGLAPPPILRGITTSFTPTWNGGVPMGFSIISVPRSISVGSTIHCPLRKPAISLPDW